MFKQRERQCTVNYYEDFNMESSRDDSMSDIKDIVCSTTGLDSPVSGDCSLSQSEIQSVLDSVFGGSFPSLFDAPKEKDSDQT